MQAQEDERDVQSPSRDIPLIPRKRFTGFVEAPRPQWSRLAA
jgi:hypothetical protein